MDESLTSDLTKEPSKTANLRSTGACRVRFPSFVGESSTQLRNSEEHTRRKYGQNEIHDQRAGSAEPTVSVIFYPYETLGSL